jgi:L,D-transpeptidase ErfK/SrfK
MRSSHGCIRLYPEDVAILFDAIPDGTKVTVVNQPYLLGWHGDRLLVQTYEPFEDDKRDWSDVPKTLRQKARKPKSPLWKKVAEHDKTIDWEAVRAAAAEPRGIAFSVGPGVGRDIAATIGQAPRVRNAIPAGATWNGVEDQYAGDPQFAKPAVAEGEKASSGN